MVRKKGRGEVQGSCIAEVVWHSSQKPTLLNADSGPLSVPAVIKSLVSSECTEGSRTTPPCSLERSKTPAFPRTGHIF